jgi:hypothetical protein
MALKKLVTTLKEKAEAVQVIVTEVQSLPEAFNYAIGVTQKQGGASIAAPGWDPESRTAAPSPWPTSNGSRSSAMPGNPSTLTTPALCRVLLRRCCSRISRPCQTACLTKPGAGYSWLTAPLIRSKIVINCFNSGKLRSTEG